MRKPFLFAVLCRCLPLVLLAVCGLSAPALAQQETQALLLVATPNSGDPYFAESVVLVTRHGKSRPMGVIINRPTGTKIGERKEGDKSDGADKPALAGRTLYFGGPVAPRNIVYVFKGDAEGRGRRDVLSLGEGLYLGIGSGVLEDAIGRKPPEDLKVFAGFASWGHGQLEDEIARGGWLLLPFEPALVFRQDTSGLWQELHARASRRRL